MLRFAQGDHESSAPRAPSAGSRLGRSGIGFVLAGARPPLLLVLMAASIPVLLFAGWIAYRAAEGQRAAARETARDTIERVADRITAEMSAQVQVAETLALSAALDVPDLTTFYREAERLKEARPLWHTVELDDPSGTQIMNLLRPLGVPLGPTADRDSFEAAVRERRPVVGGIGPVGPVSGQRLVALRVPVMRGGELRYVLTVAFVPSAIGSILRGAGAPEGWIGAVVDRRGNVVARTAAEEATQGQPASPALREAIERSPGGFYRGRTLEGVEVETVFKLLPESGSWSVHLGVPSDVLDKPIHRSLYAVGAGVLASLALSGGLASLVSREISRQRREEERRASAALEASEARGALAVEAAELGTWSWDVEGGRVVGSERCRALLDLPRSGEVESDWASAAFLDAVHPDDRAHVEEAARRCLGEDRPFDVEFRAPRPDGSRWLRALGRDGHGAILGVISNITGQKRAEEERRELLRRLSAAQEEVQGRIARELHDQVGQTVTGLSLGLKGLERALDAPGEPRRTMGGAADGPDLRDQVRWLQRLTDEIGRDIHRAAADLRPTALDDLGLLRALSAHAADWSRRHGVPVDVQVVGLDGERLPAEIETVVYRVVQEALTNVLKHAKARQVSVVLERRPRELRVVIEDDGVGFDPEEVEAPDATSPDGPDTRRRLGLSGMRERLALIGGTLRIESAPGTGTAHFVQIPLEPQPAGAASS